MALVLKLVGIGMGTPTSWRSPDDYEAGEVPRLPGIYLLRGVQEDGSPVPLEPATEHGNAMRRQIESHPLLQGVLYIGLAGRPIGQNGHPSRNTLRQRFAGDLLGSWRASSLPKAQGKWRHDSRSHYEAKDAPFRGRFPLSRVQTCYIPMLATAWLKKVPADAQSLIDAFEWDAANNYVGLWEAQLIQEYKRCFGTIPPLNDREEGASDSQMPAEALNARLAGMEQDLGTMPALHFTKDETCYLYCDPEMAEHLANNLSSHGYDAEVQDNALEIRELPLDAPSVRSLRQSSGTVNLDEAMALFTERGESDAVVLLHPPLDKQAIENTINELLFTMLLIPDEENEENLAR